MGYNYSYKLKENPKLVSLGEIKFDPITEEHKARVEREIKRYRANRRSVFFRSIIFFIIGLAFLVGSVWFAISYKNIMILALLPALFALFFLAAGAIQFMFSVPISVDYIKEGVVADRETHQYYTEDVYGYSVPASADHVTVRFPELDKEVSITCDSYTQMHCIPGKKVYILSTSVGPIISFDD
ncbi:MAG: hypothetical protein J6U54_21155 [Clostridiales bacterium]|nr:hypothetical protein [Clostridiales bacterium]